MTKLGFTLEYEENDCWKIVTVPAMLKNSDPRDVVLRILDSVGEGGENYGKEVISSEKILSDMALVMARASAIQRGAKLGNDEMEHLIGELFSLPDPAYTPNGNMIYCVLDAVKLESMFR